MKEESKQRINKLITPLTKRTLSFLTATTMLVTGITGCKEDDKTESSDITTSINSTSSEDTVPNDVADSSIISSSEDIFSSEEQSSMEDSSIVSSSNTNKPSTNSSHTTSKPSSSTTSSSDSKPSNNSSKPSSTSSSSKPTSSTPSTPSVPTMPSSLTASNINDVEVFKYFADKLRQEIGGGLFSYNGKFLSSEIGSKVTLAILNQQYLTNETMLNLFGELSLEEFQNGGEFIHAMVSEMLTSGTKYSYNKFCIDKSMGNYLFNNQDVFIKNDQKEMVDVLTDFYLNDIKMGYGVHFWVDCYMRRIFNTEIDFNILENRELGEAYFNSLASMTEFNNKVADIYNKFHNKVKIIN